MVFKKFVNDGLDTGCLRHSSSPIASPIFFVAKKDGGLRPCIDYRGLNSRTKPNRHPLPLINVILQRPSRAKYFTVLDLHGACNLLRIKEGDEWKTAFRCVLGIFESLVVTFGLHGAPGVFQRFMNWVLRKSLDVCCVVYLDDILIYSDTLEQHIIDVKSILKTLSEYNLYCKLSKCQFHLETVHFLGFVLEISLWIIKGCKLFWIGQSQKPCVKFNRFLDSVTTTDGLLQTSPQWLNN
jgi:hypothetical protein